MRPSLSWLTGIAEKLRRFMPNSRGNVALIATFAMVPLLLATGMGIDYSLAARRQDQINGYADAAALAAVTPNAMLGSSSAAQTTALNNFNAQLSTLTGVTYSGTNISVVATDTVAGTTVTRVATVTWSGGSNNAFAALLGLNTIGIGGSSRATSGVAPNTNFYLLVDTSPSMEIAATTTDIATMVSNTSPQNGCAFACHESDPAADSLSNPSKLVCTGAANASLGILASPSKSFPSGGEDNYALARCLNVTLRMDLVQYAIQQLMSTAQQAAVLNDTTYNASIYTMDYSLNQLMAMSPLATSGQATTAAGYAGNIQPLEVYDNSCLTSSNCNNDEDSYLDAAVAGMNVTSIMPNPGQGTNNAGDSPQEVLMIVSDGVIDENSSGTRVMDPINTYQMTSLVNNCTAIKNRGIRIAFLYLTYYPLPTNTFYQNNIAPFQSQIATAAQSCASGDLYSEVSTNGDVTGALSALFQKAISEAHLLQ